MSRVRAWQRAGAARELAYDLKQTSPARSILEKTDPNLGVYAILELLAAAIQDLTLDEHPLRLSELKIGGLPKWWD